MSDNIRNPSLARKAGRGFLRALRGLLGGGTVDRAARSWDTLRSEYAAGREEAKDAPPRSVPHRDLKSE